jgi:hypothetical protein
VVGVIRPVPGLLVASEPQSGRAFAKDNGSKTPDISWGIEARSLESNAILGDREPDCQAFRLPIA